MPRTSSLLLLPAVTAVAFTHAQEQQPDAIVNEVLQNFRNFTLGFLDATSSTLSTLDLPNWTDAIRNVTVIPQDGEASATLQGLGAVAPLAYSFDNETDPNLHCYTASLENLANFTLCSSTELFQGNKASLTYEPAIAVAGNDGWTVNVTTDGTPDRFVQSSKLYFPDSAGIELPKFDGSRIQDAVSAISEGLPQFDGSRIQEAAKKLIEDKQAMKENMQLPEFDGSRIQEAVSAISEGLPEFDLTKVQETIQKLGELPELDFSGVEEAVKKMIEDKEAMKKDMNMPLKEEIKKAIDDGMMTMKEAVANIQQQIASLSDVETSMEKLMEDKRALLSSFTAGSESG